MRGVFQNRKAIEQANEREELEKWASVVASDRIVEVQAVTNYGAHNKMDDVTNKRRSFLRMIR